MKRKGSPIGEGDQAAAKVPRSSEADAVHPGEQNGAAALLVADRPPATVVHEVALPEGSTHQPKAPKPGSKPAKEYPFVLDPFQVSVLAGAKLQNECSGLVSEPFGNGGGAGHRFDGGGAALAIKCRVKICIQ